MPAKWFSIRAAKTEEPVEILIYDQIGEDWFGGDGVSAKDFAEELKNIPETKAILVSINSPGGNVWDGLAIYNQLKRRKKYVTVRVDGIAASIASIIAMAGNSIEMPENSMMMIHEASGLAMGDAQAMLEMADRLEKHSDLLAGIYADKTGRSREAMRALMRDETWMDGRQAHALGFADKTTAEIKLAANFNLTAFRRVPSALSVTPPNPPPQPQAGNTKQQMDKKQIIALLAQHGKQLAEDASDEIILAALKECVTNGKITQAQADAARTTEPPILINPAEFRAISAQLKQEREARIRGEFKVIAMDRPFLVEEEWLPKLYACTDDSLMATLRAMPVVNQNQYAPPHPAGPIQNMGATLIEKYRGMKPGRDRQAFAVENWNTIQAAFESHHIQAMSSLPISEQLRRLHMPQNVNTYSATLVTDRLADGLITTLGTKLASLRGFSREFGTDRMKPKATVQVRRITTTSAVQTNPTNFETGDTTSTAASVTVDQISKSFHATNDELNKGHQVQQAAEKNSQTFANGISDVVTAIMTVANFGAGLQIGTAENFERADLAPIYAVAKNYGVKNLILDGGHLAFLLPQDRQYFRIGEEGAYGFDLIAEQNRWTGAITNTVGFICDPNAIAICSGLPVDLPAADFLELNTVELPGLGLTVQLSHWFARAARVHWMAYDVMFGAQAGDQSAAEVLITV